MSEVTYWSQPNQQVVRDGDPVGFPNDGDNPDPPLTQEADDGDDLDGMTKAELIAYAQESGVTPANNDMTKAELIDSIRSQTA